MDILTTGLVSLLALGVAVTMLFWHVRVWRWATAQPLAPRERDYRWRQFRRRMQSSAMLAILAVAVFAGRLIIEIHGIAPLFVLIYWGAVLLWLCWIGLLAAVDVWATNFYFGRMRHECRIEQARLLAEGRKREAESKEQKTEN